MPEELRPGLFRIEIPMPESPLKYLNSFVIKTDERHLIIDTGLNRDECHQAMLAGLDEIGVSLEDCDFFITHLHADHFGLVSRLYTEGAKIYFTRSDAELIENWEGWEPMLAYVGANGFPVDDLRKALAKHPGFKHQSGWTPPLEMLADGDVIQAGDYTFECITTPGHTRGHLCLYEPGKKIFVAGDHILIDITPNIQCYSDDDQPLVEYLESLDKVRDLEVELVLPGHRRLFSDLAGRVDELKAHHRRRLDEVLEILAAGPQHAYDVAGQMSWDLRVKSWADFPIQQKWFATVEAVSHLRCLLHWGDLARQEQDGVIFYRLP